MNDNQVVKIIEPSVVFNFIRNLNIDLKNCRELGDLDKEEKLSAQCKKIVFQELDKEVDSLNAQIIIVVKELTSALIKKDLYNRHLIELEDDTSEHLESLENELSVLVQRKRYFIDLSRAICFFKEPGEDDF